MLRHRFEVGPAFPRRRFRGAAHGAARPVHRCPARPRRRSIHASLVCRPRREGATADLGTHEGGTGGPEGEWGGLGNPTNMREAGCLGRAAGGARRVQSIALAGRGSSRMIKAARTSPCRDLRGSAEADIMQ